MKENEAYAESLAFKQNELNASFQELANNLISSDLVGGILSFANAMLQLDNATGNVISRILLLTSLGWGGSQLLRVSKIIPVITEQFKNFAFVIDTVRGGAGTLGEAFNAVGKGTGVLAGFFSSSLPIMLAVAAAITAIIVLVKGLKQMYDATFPTIDSFNQAIAEDNEQLETNKQRLEEINKIPWNERTQEILDEKAALEEENDELEKNIKLNEQKKLTAAKTAMLGDEGSAAYVSGGTFLGGYSPTTGDKDGSRASEENIALMQKWTNALQQEGKLTDEQNTKLQELLPKLAERKEYYDVLVENYKQLSKEEQAQVDALGKEMSAYEKLVSVYDRAVYGQDTLAESYQALIQVGYLTEEQYKRLISIYPTLASYAEQTADGYILQKDALYALMNAETQQTTMANLLINGLIGEAQQAGKTKKEILDLAYAHITASNSKLDFSQQVLALQQLAIQAGYTAQYVSSVLGPATGISQSNIERTAQGLMHTGQYKNYEAALAEATRRAQSAMKYQWNKLTSTAPSTGWSQSFLPSTSATTELPSSSWPTTTDSTSKSETAAKKARQAEIKALQQERDEIQETIDAINDKYDAQIKALEKVNDELEDEIELQQILEEMASAKATKKMVYKDGRFQYVSDIDAVAAAQVKLDEYNRKKALKDQKAAIEKQRQLELASYQQRKDDLDKQIKVLQDYYDAEYDIRDSAIEDYQSQADAMAKARQDALDAYKKQVEEAERLAQEMANAMAGDGTTTPSDSKTPLTDAAKKEADSLTPAQRAIYDMWKRRGVGHEEAMRQAKKTGGGTSGSTSNAAGSIAAKYPSASYDSSNNKAFSSSTIKNLQKWYGSNSDGIWGPNSYKAAGNRNIATAYALWMAVKGRYSSFSAFKKAGGYAGGTLGAMGGMHMVGENGPELRVLNKGGGVIPARQTATLWSFANNQAKFLANFVNRGAGTSTTINVANVTLPNVNDTDGFIGGLKNMALQRAYARQ